MEVGAVYTFTEPSQFWSELGDILLISPESTFAELDYALRSYVAFVGTYLDEYLRDPQDLDTALFALLQSDLFTHHTDRMTATLITLLTQPPIPPASSLPTSPVSPTPPPLPLTPPSIKDQHKDPRVQSTLFILLMLLLHLGLSNPLSPSASLRHSDPATTNSTKVFKALRGRWFEVVPVLLECVEESSAVQGSKEPAGEEKMVMPEDGWEERVGTAATAVLYEVCRVMRLGRAELALFKPHFIDQLFNLVESTRDASDETFNYTLIKLLIALNEQFMVSSLPPPGTHKDNGGNSLPPPIMPKIMHENGDGEKREEGNLVLKALKEREGDSKTFGENVIFILNRSNGTPDSLCVSLLILKLLYLLFTTSGTSEYFYVNDLCVLVDVFIRELNDLGEESEGVR
ncbi:hypothetical protein MNV49_007659 [Pseudohyphozyma bogoriensis]|nr:hypothetical protein MNV49_007659 [Pseudohyphozyma bogoriensis]